MVPADVDVVVIGAGGFGASAAFHAAAAGLRVLVLDRSEPVAETSAMAAGIAMHVHPTEAGSRLAIRSAALVHGLAETTGEALALHRAGSVKIARTAPHAAIVADEIAFGRRLGVAIDPLERAEAAALLPWLDLAGATAISIVRHDMHFEPGDLPRRYLAAAEARGAAVLARAAALRLVVRDGRVEAEPLKWSGSSDLVAFMQADALIVIPEDCPGVAAGELVELLSLRD